MSNGFIPYGSADSAVVWQDDLKDDLVPADISGVWTTLQIGSDDLSFDNYGSVVHGHLPTHDSDKGLKQVSISDGSTETGYRIAGNVAGVLDDMDNQGQLSFDIEAAAIDTYVLGWNQNAFQFPANRQPVISFTGTGSDNIQFVRLDSGTDAARYMPARKTIVNADLDYINGIRQSTSFVGVKTFIASAFNKTGFRRVQFSWKGNTGFIAIDGVPFAWDTRDLPADASLLFSNLYLAGNNGIATSFLSEYFIKNIVIAKEPANYSLSHRFRKIGVMSDSMFDDVNADSTTGGGVDGGRQGIIRALAEVGLYAQIDISENAGEDSATLVSGGFVAAHIAANPDMKHVFLHCGTNDANDNNPIVQATIESNLEAIIDLYFAATTDIDSMTLIIPPSRYAVDSTNPALNAAQVSQRQANQVIYANAVNTMTDYVATTHSTKSITILDMREYIGDSPPANSLRGIHSEAIAEGLTSLGDIHYSNIGSTYLGYGCYKAMKAII